MDTLLLLPDLSVSGTAQGEGTESRDTYDMAIQKIQSGGNAVNMSVCQPPDSTGCSENDSNQTSQHRSTRGHTTTTKMRYCGHVCAPPPPPPRVYCFGWVGNARGVTLSRLQGVAPSRENALYCRVDALLGWRRMGMAPYSLSSPLRSLARPGALQQCHGLHVKLPWQSHGSP